MLSESTLSRLRIVDSSQLTAQVITALPEQIQSGTRLGVTRDELREAQKVVDDLLAFIAELQKKLDALPTPPSPLPPGTIALTGIDDKFSFGLVPIFTSADKTFQITTKANRPVTFVELAGLEEPFAFKGGAFPGTGGTCKAAIAENCTIVLTFSPKGVGGVEDANWLKYRPAVTLKFRDGAESGSSNTLVIGGTSERTSSIGELVAVVRSAPAQVFPGEKAEFYLELRRKEVSAGQPVFFKDITISGVPDPFSIVRNDCAKEQVHRDWCDIVMQFAPSRPGTFTNQVAFSVNTGFGAPKAFTVAVSGTALSRPDELDASRHLLVVYNENWPESVETKNYYLANRPGFAAANTLGVRFPFSARCPEIVCLSETLESVHFREIQEKIVNPIISWLRAHSDKDIHYIVLIRGLPTRNQDPPADISGPYSVQALIRDAVSRVLSKEIFLSSLDTGTLESTKAYVDKLKRVYGAMPQKSVVISARGTNMSGTTYYFSDSYLGEGVTDKLKAPAFAEALRAANSSAQIVTRGNILPVLSSASDVTGFLIHGIYGYNSNSNYAVDGTIRFSGNSGWYAMSTVESFNGLWMAAGHQGNFIKWFSKNAFGGSNYEHTPAAATTYVKEPTSNSVQPSLFTCWDVGKPFAYCAWKSQIVAGSMLQVVGDPWVTR